MIRPSDDHDLGPVNSFDVTLFPHEGDEDGLEPELAEVLEGYAEVIEKILRNNEQIQRQRSFDLYDEAIRAMKQREKMHYSYQPPEKIETPMEPIVALIPEGIEHIDPLNYVLHELYQESITY